MKKSLIICSVISFSSSVYAVQGTDMATGQSVQAQSTTPTPIQHLSMKQEQNPNSLNLTPSTNVTPTTNTAGGYVGDGFGVGIQIGNTSGSSKYSQPTNTQKHGLNGPLGGLHVDYGYTFYSLYFVGAEVYGNLENANFGFIAASGMPWDNSNRKIGNNYGFVLMPGFHLSPSNLLYGKAGVNQANIHVGTATQDYNRWEVGSDFGLGFKQALTTNISLGLEYDWIYYPKGINIDTFVYPGETHMGQNIYQLSLDYQLDKMDPSNHGSQVPLQLTGPYVGVAVGLKSQQYKIEGLSGALTGSQSLWYAGNGAAERFKGGYSYQFNSWFDLAAEAFFEATQNVATTEFSTTDATKEGNSYGLSLLPGYVINQSNLLFARIGGIYTKLESVEDGGSFIPYKVYKTGLQLGLGYETALMKNLSLVLEYDYTQYPNFDVSNGSANRQISIADNYFNLGLNYRF